MFAIFIYTKFHMPKSKASLVTAVKLKPRKILLTAAILLFHSEQDVWEELIRYFPNVSTVCEVLKRNLM
jgi:hypothetical protein